MKKTPPVIPPAIPTSHGYCISRGGFALVIALGLMSFLLILIMSLSTLVRVDLATHDRMVDRLQAERAAVFALETALGKLQETAGPDQRVTARADILNGGYSGLSPVDSTANWTGVWRSDDIDLQSPQNKTFVGWLASMSDGQDILNTAGQEPDNSVTLVSERTNNAGKTSVAVKAEAMTIANTDTACAWVVLDEGIKAKINTNSWESNTDIYTDSSQLNQELRFGPSEGAKAGILTGFENFRDTLSTQERMRLTGLRDTDIFYDQSPGEGYFHDLTTASYGVLANVRDGGLRRDLSRGLGDGFAALSGTNVLDVLPVKWDSLKAWYGLYRQLDDPGALLPVLNPMNTLPEDWTGSREEFAVETALLSNGGIEGWQLNSHPIAPVVQQFIWRLGGFTSDYNNNQRGNTWDWRSDRPGSNFNKEQWAFLRWGRHIISPLVVLWNPYNVALDASDYRISYDPDVQMQIMAYDPDAPANVEDIATTSTRDLLDLWEGNHSTERTDGHFTVELFAKYDRKGVVNTDQTVLQPGEMKIFGLQYTEPTGGGSFAENSHGGGFGGWSEDTPLQMIGPVNNAPNTTFRTVINSQGVRMDDVHLDWVQDSLNLDFGSNTASSDPNDFRLTLTLADAAYEGPLNEGFVVRDVWGLRPPSSASGNYPFATIWAPNSTDEPFTLYDYSTVIRSNDNQVGAGGADILYAASIVARLKASASELGADSVPIIAHFNPLAWNTRASHPNEQHSPLWDVSVFNRSEWNLNKTQNNTLNGLATWGNSISSVGQERAVLKEIPRQPLFSVGQFMHADIGIFDTVPLYTVGGSYAPPFGSRTSRIFDGNAEVDGNSTALEAIDLSWYYNDALFDEWFFSTVPDTGQSTQYAPFEEFNLDYIKDGKNLPNSRYRYYTDTGEFDANYEGRLHDIDTAAASLMVDGAFNINSTSPEAWKAVLSSLSQSGDFYFYNAAAGSDISDVLGADEMGVPIPRFLHPMGSNSNADQGDSPQAWAGFRSLSDAELDELANEIVNQVRLRGPFRSLSDFVNRRLVDDATGSSGALQAALDATVNSADAFGGEPTQTEIWDDVVDWDEYAPASGAGAPGWVLQNDILQTLAPVLSARSDTFRIRTYGAALNKFTGETTAQAWCEAIVQRVPNWVDPSEAAEDDPNTPDNVNLGRRFIVVSFRWLQQTEI